MTGQKLFLFFCFFSTRYGDQDVCGAHTLLVGGGIINKRRPGRTLAAWVFFPFFFWLGNPAQLFVSSRGLRGLPPPQYDAVTI
jgi:hypothetical protein